MALIREIAIAPDPTAYDYSVIESKIAADGLGSTGDWTSIRVNSMSITADRDKIMEEAIDTIAPSSVYAGADKVSGQFEGALRFLSYHDSGLLEAIMGQGSCAMNGESAILYSLPSEVGGSIPDSTFASYQMTMQPATIKIRIVDEQARRTDGIGYVKLFRGVGVMGTELTLNVKEYAMARCNWVGRRAETYSSGVENITSTITGEPSIFYNAVLKFGGQTLRCKGITVSINRPIDQDLFYIGSEFLQDLVYNGITELGGQITLGAPEYTVIQNMLAGSAVNNTLDQGHTEFYGDLDNSVPGGSLYLYFRNPAGTKTVGLILISEAKLTQATASVQGRNQWEKQVQWTGIIDANNNKNMYVYVNTSTS